MDEIEAPLYELPQASEQREERRLRQAVRQGQRRKALKAAPGGGKTFATRLLLAETALESAARLEGQTARLDEIVAPIWVTAQALAQSTAPDIGEALVQSAESALSRLHAGPRLGLHCRTWFQQAAASPRAFVVVDALDELTDADRNGFRNRAAQLGQLGGRMLVTCRTMHWEERRGWLSWPSVDEMELAPFKPRQQREFSRRFFTGQPELAQTLLRLLQTSFALRQTCSNPLLMTFACLLHEEGKVNEGTTRALLYAHMLRKVVSGEWRGAKPAWDGNQVLAERCLYFLDNIAWGIFSKAPELNRFTLADWQAAADAYDRQAPLEPATFIEQLQKVGLVAPAGFDERGDLHWSVVHRTFLEFLAARALSRMQPDIWLAEAKKHFWFQPEWLEVLTFLAGLVKDATPLVETIGNEQDDLFGSMLYLQARLVGAAWKVHETVLKCVCDDAFRFWYGTLSGWRDCLRDMSVPVIVALGANTIGTTSMETKLLELTRDKDEHIRWAALEALGEIGTERAVDRLLQLLWDEDLNVCLSAAGLLGPLGGESAVDRLMGLIQDEDLKGSLEVAIALGQIGAESAVDRLLELTRDKDKKVRHEATAALGQIGAESAVDRLLELTRDKDKYVRRTAVGALGEIGAESAVDRLLELTRDKDKFMRLNAALALGGIGAERAVDRLLELMRDRHEWVRFDAARALGNIGAERAVDRLLELTRDRHKWVRRPAADALGYIGAERAVDRLLELTRDREPSMRSGAAAGLGMIDAKSAVDRLIELTWDEVSWVRRAAAAGLGRIGAESAVDRLLELTWVEVGDVGRTAAEALGTIGTERAVDRLLELTRSEERLMREDAAKALWQIAWKRHLRISPD